MLQGCRADAVADWGLSSFLPSFLLSSTMQSFGELSSITRVANGDLHIDFRKAEVADTVCVVSPARVCHPANLPFCR